MTKLCIAVLATILLVQVASAALVGSPRKGHHHKDEGCPKCVPDACPKGEGECSMRGPLVRDVCGCCPQGVCGLPEGANCYNASLSHVLPKHSIKYGGCGENLECLLRHDLNDRDEPEALCMCKETQEACGSDGRTYESVCQMGHESARKGTPLYLKHWGPCASVPWVVTGPSDSSASLHQGLALDCEVKGFPIPAVHWEFVGDDGTRRTLPADDLFVAVQVRGGPEPYMVTSWLQIVDLRHSDMGTYTCVATNAEGAATAAATVGVRA